MAETADDTAAPPTPPPPKDPITLHTRREPFEHGLLPIPKLIFPDTNATLTSLKSKLLLLEQQRVSSAVLADALQISGDLARLILDTLASVLPSESDPLVAAKPDDVESVGVDVFDLILFLYIQTYKRLLPRTHKDSAAVADVWPSTSAFDGYLSALSPLQGCCVVGKGCCAGHKGKGLTFGGGMVGFRVVAAVGGKGGRRMPATVVRAGREGKGKQIKISKLVRSNSRKFMPSQTDEEAHQLSYLQKHLANILTLLAEPVEGEGDESLVLSMERFEHLGFLIQFGEKGSDPVPLSQASPFFANSDPDMPAAPVSAAQVHDWLLQKIADALERIAERTTAKENGPSSCSDQDVAMADASTTKASTSSRGLTFIEGVSKSSYVKQAAELKGSSLKVLNCHESVIYVLAPFKYATIYGCSDTTIVLGAVGKALRVEHCERVHLIVAAKRICIANCRECMFYLGVNQRPLIVGDNHKLQVAPYNTFYPELEEHMNQVGVEPTLNMWNEPLPLGVVDPHDSLSHPAGVSDAQAETAALLDPDQFTNFLIPNWFAGEVPGPTTKDNPFPLPEAYLASQHKNHSNLGEVKQVLQETPLDEAKKRELSCALHVLFKDWLYASGNIRQLYCLQGD